MVENYLRAQGQTIVDARGKTVYLRGINLGGWLMKEAYLLHAPNFPERKMKQTFIKALGQEAWDDWEATFRAQFIQKDDFARIRNMGLNCVRVPFHYRLVESTPGQYDSAGVKYLDQVMDWAGEYQLYVILDLHAAPGCQNHDWHSDSLGAADFWKRPAYQTRACRIWEFLASRYADKEFLAGYDLLNEAVVEDTALLNNYYRSAIAALRRHDTRHIVFIEGNRWATDLGCLDRFEDENYVLSFHTYEPLDMTFNFVPLKAYPAGRGASRYDARNLRAHLQSYLSVARQRQVPLFVGEFGVHYRAGQSGELKWLEDNLSLFKEYGFHWTYWTYKAVKNFMFPDGVFSYYPNTPWVNRHGPLSGWDTYHLHWPMRKAAMAESWCTQAFECHQELAELLKIYAAQD